MKKLFLIRHAESILNKAGKNQGSDIDSDLTKEGIIQTNKLVERLKKENISKIYCSDIGRAIKTAKILSGKLLVPLVLESNLRELKIGDWAKEENPLKKWMTYYEEEKAKGNKRENIRPPNGENSWDHINRVSLFLSKISNLNDNIAIVAHSGTNKVMIGVLEGKDPDNFYTIRQDNACINEIEYINGKWKVVKVNDTSHLN
jgi:broad specificity phosphatase PhoE